MDEPGVAGVRRRIRRARPDEAEILSELAMRSKAHWGYGPDFLEACRRDLTLTSDFIELNEVYVLDVGGRAVGFYSLTDRDGALELGHFFVDPPSIGEGAGKRLCLHALERASALEADELLVESDPYAEEFYRRLGAERIGTSPSAAVKGRLLPLLRFRMVDDRLDAGEREPVEAPPVPRNRTRS